MPDPRISSQPVCLHTRQPSPPHITQVTSTSALGSVNGKKLGRMRIFVSLPNISWANCKQGPFQVAHPDVLIDDEPFDLREHMGMGRIVIIAAVDACPGR